MFLLIEDKCQTQSDTYYIKRFRSHTECLCYILTSFLICAIIITEFDLSFN